MLEESYSPVELLQSYLPVDLLPLLLPILEESYLQEEKYSLVDQLPLPLPQVLPILEESSLVTTVDCWMEDMYIRPMRWRSSRILNKRLQNAFLLAKNLKHSKA
jgi:hypothetical protein